MCSLNPNPRKQDRVQGNIQSMLQLAVTLRRSDIEDKVDKNQGRGVVPLFFYGIICESYSSAQISMVDCMLYLI